jgi:NADH-quinone oxidoreductase subunit G
MYEMLLLRDGDSMSERIQHRGKLITITIDGKECKGVYGQTILDIARENDIYIPTMCYLKKLTPIASCRMCSVKVEGVDGHILSCQEKAVDGAVVITQSDELQHERQNIMKLYNVNHPLQCGVCDKSGECELQDKTLEFAVDSQEFAVKDNLKKKKSWGVLSYDPSLCIVCERCVHTCNEVIGAAALYVKPGGYNSTIDNKMSRCEQCGECIAVCPVGAMASTDYKYTTNAWETKKIPSTCTHCSSQCPLYYDVKHAGLSTEDGEKIYRVVSDFEFDALCGAGKFAYNYENTNTSGDINAAVDALQNAGTIKFNSFITNEEAYILQELKNKLGVKLVNEDAKDFQNFLNSYSSVTGKSLYSGTSKDIADSNAVIMLGCRVYYDNPALKYNLNKAIKKTRAEFIYMHPMEDPDLQTKITQFVKYEVGSEEAVLALLATYLLKDKEVASDVKSYLESLDIGYLSGESSVGEEECEEIVRRLIKRKNKTLVIGSDVYGHERAANIAKLVAIIDKYSDFKVVLNPSQTNTLGVSLICDLDAEAEGKVVGYNVKGDFTISNDGKGDFNVPALNQQEGTFTGVDLKVLNTNVAVAFKGFCLNDLANKILDQKQAYTINYTPLLANNDEFKPVEFDSLGNGYDKYGTDRRGYELNSVDVEANGQLEEVGAIKSYNGVVVYECQPRYQFNGATGMSLTSSMSPKTDTLVKGSATFAAAAKIKNGDIKVTIDGQTYKKKFKLDKGMTGTVGLFPTYDSGLAGNPLSSGYRYKQVQIEQVEKPKPAPKPDAEAKEKPAKAEKPVAEKAPKEEVKAATEEKGE